jgi:hypothetical protein
MIVELDGFFREIKGFLMFVMRIEVKSIKMFERRKRRKIVVGQFTGLELLLDLRPNLAQSHPHDVGGDEGEKAGEKEDGGGDSMMFLIFGVVFGGRGRRLDA